MRKAVIRLIGMILAACILCSGCAGRDAEIYDKAAAPSSESAAAEPRPEPAGSGELRGSLTISTYWDTNIESFTGDFMELHPGVYIEVERPEEGDLTTYEQYIERTAVELMAGTAADRVEMAGLCSFKYADSGLLCDIYEYMDSDPGFDKAEYYANIFEASEHGGRLYALPSCFCYDVMYSSAPLLKRAGLALPEALDYRSMFDLYDKASAAGAGAPRLFPGAYTGSFFGYEVREYYDTEKREARFTSAQFKEYLELTKEYLSEYDGKDKTRVIYSDDFMEKDYLFCVYDVSAGADMAGMLLELPNVNQPVQLMSTGGGLLFDSMRGEYGIAQSCPNKALAWEFLKFYIGEKEPPALSDTEAVLDYISNYYTFVPVNRKNFENSFKYDFLYYYERAGLGEASEYKDGYIEKLLDEALERVDGWNLARNTRETPVSLTFLLSKDLDDYYSGAVTAEEAAALVQDKMQTWLRE